MPNCLANTHVLLCDDSSDIRHAICDVLNSAGAKVTQTENGKQAIQAISDSQTEYDIVLMDMQMPIMDGYAAARQIRSKGFSRPMIALTSLTMSGDREKCREAGCSDFLPKPLQLGLLLQTMVQWTCAPEDSIESSTDLASTDDFENDDFDLAMDITFDELAMEQRIQRMILQSPRIPKRLLTLALDRSSDLTPATLPKIHSSLPTEQPRFRWVVEQFVSKLANRIMAMQAAIDAKADHELAEHANWLKGAGGTMGFDCFTQPSLAIYHRSVEGDATGQQDTLDEIRTFAERIELPWKTNSSRNKTQARDGQLCQTTNS